MKHRDSLPRIGDSLPRGIVDAQRSCSILGSVQGQFGWGIEEPGVVEGVLSVAGGFGNRVLLRSLPNKTIL